MNPQGLNSLTTDGITLLENLFTPATIQKWNQLLDPHFAKLSHEARSEMENYELYKLGLFNDFFNDEVRFLIYKIMPDAVLFDFHVYETAANQTKSHIVADRLEGWHVDVKPLPGLDVKQPHYLSLFVHLSDVRLEDGAFEILPQDPYLPIKSGLNSIRAVGEKGTAYLWNKAFFHRASPNTGPQRRRMLKVSFQHNYLENDNLKIFSNILKDLQSSPNPDPFLTYLCGTSHKSSHHGERMLPAPNSAILNFKRYSTNSVVQSFSLSDKLRLLVKRFLKLTANY